jgi:hypothetical protein
MRTTRWFAANSFIPTRPGAYEVAQTINFSISGGLPERSWKYWNGECWGWASASPDFAEYAKLDRPIANQTGFKWRGLLKESK